MRRVPPFLIVSAALAAAGCGRLGYNERAIDDDGGPPDARDGDATADQPDGGPMPVGCVADLVVTTTADEDDTGESPEPPHLGAGLSLREAITIANDRAGLDCITFSAVTALSLGSELPSLEDPDGTAIDGAGAVSIAGGAVATGFRLISAGNQIYNLEMSGTLVCIQVNGAAAAIRGVHLRDCSTSGILVAAAADATTIGPCLIHDVQDTAIQALGSSGLQIAGCTISNNGGSGVDATAGGGDLLVENSIVSDNRDYGIALDPDAPSAIDYVDLFGNRLEACLNCTPGTSSLSQNPLFMDATTADYRLQAGSPAIDAGRINGLDVNGAAAGDYNGVAPDMGGLESL
jgi:hypothetical protein